MKQVYRNVQVITMYKRIFVVPYLDTLGLQYRTIQIQIEEFRVLLYVAGSVTVKKI